MKDLYHAFVSPRLKAYRSDWDNFSEDVCYASPDTDFQNQMDGVLRDRQKKENDKNEVEKAAHESEDHCARVCESESSREVEYELNEEEKDNEDGKEESSRMEGSASRMLAWALKEKKADTLRKQNAKRAGFAERSSSSRCFQYRYRKGVCCTSRSFRLGVPRDVEPTDEEKWHSGWYLKGINDWISSMGECKEPAWKAVR
jgi:hypothetical protein